MRFAPLLEKARNSPDGDHENVIFLPVDENSQTRDPGFRIGKGEGFRFSSHTPDGGGAIASNAGLHAPGAGAGLLRAGRHPKVLNGPAALTGSRRSKQS